MGHMQAAFATNANIGVRPISAIDDHRFDLEHPGSLSCTDIRGYPGQADLRA